MSRLPALRVTLFDRLLMRIAPRWAMRRVRARHVLQLTGARNYKAASGGRRTDGWYRNNGDANVAGDAPTIQVLRELSRDLVRNNPLAKRAIGVIATNTTGGWGIKAAATGPRRKEAMRAWNAWAKSPACDYDGRVPFAGVQALVMRTVPISGAALVLMPLDPDAPDGTIPLRLRVLEPDYLDTSKDGELEGGGRIMQGIQVDARGRRVGYHLFRQHPGSAGMRSLESQFVPANEVLHIYDPERPGALQGVPWAAAAIPKLHDLGEYDDATLMQKKIAAMFAAFVEDADGLGMPLGQLPGESGEGDIEDADRLETFEPGQIQYLPSGKKITFANPPQHTDHDPFTKNSHRTIAAAFDITYEDLTGDYSQVNYSSARMARLAFYRKVHDWRWNMLIPQFCDGVWRRAMEILTLERGWQNAPGVEWTPPPMPMLDPDKEGKAFRDNIRSGLITFFEAIREQGFDPEAHLDEIADANEALDERGIWLDCDPRRIAAGGATAQLTQGPDATDESNDEPAEDDESASNGASVQ